MNVPTLVHYSASEHVSVSAVEAILQVLPEIPDQRFTHYLQLPFSLNSNGPFST
jgi:hypothetical protein